MRAPRQPPPTPSRAQQSSLTGRQAELLDQLEELFLANGFASLTLDDIVSQLRCSKMTLYMLARSREQLILAVVRRFFENATHSIDDRLLQADDGEEHIRVSLDAFGDEMQRMSVTCFNDILEFGTTSEIYDSFADAYVTKLRAMLASFSGREGRSVKRPTYVAEVARVILKEILAGDLEERTGLSRSKLLNETAALLLAGLGSPSPSGHVKLVK